MIMNENYYEDLKRRQVEILDLLETPLPIPYRADLKAELQIIEFELERYNSGTFQMIL